MRKVYYSDTLSRIKLKLRKCAEVVEIATDFAGEGDAKLKKIEQFCEKGMAVETKNKLADMLVKDWNFRVSCLLVPREATHCAVDTRSGPLALAYMHSHSHDGI